MNTFYKTLVVLLLITNVSVAQNVDGLLKSLKSSKDTSRVILLNQLSEAYSKMEVKPKKNAKKVEPDHVYDFAAEALKYAEEINYKKGIAISHFNLGKYYLSKKNYRGAEIAFLNSKELAKELKDHPLVLDNLEFIYLFHKELGNANNAIAYANMKSEYKSVMINELQKEIEDLSTDIENSIKRNADLQTLLKAKETKEKELQLSLAQKPKVETIIEYKTTKNHWPNLILTLMLIALGFFSYQVNQSKKEKSKLYLETLVKLKEVERSYKEAIAEKKIVHKFLVESDSQQKNILNSDISTGDINIRTGQLLSQASYIIQKNELLNQLKENFNELKDSKVEDLSKKVFRIGEFIDTNYDAKKDWESFLVYFENAFPEYINNSKEKLKSLSDLEIKLLAMRKVNLTNHEIACILHIEEDELQKRMEELDRKV